MSNKTDDDLRVDGWTRGNFDIADAFDMAQAALTQDDGPTFTLNTLHEAHQAFTAALELQAEPRLPFPAAPFNDKAALHQIFAKEDEITQFARAFNDADEKRKKAKLALDQAHEQLSAMIAVIRVREEERRDELYERDPLAEALARREILMSPVVREGWSPEERAAVIAWATFNEPATAPPPLPFVLASSHVAGPEGAPQVCTQCAAVLVEVGGDGGGFFPEGWFVGTGCPGKPKAPEPEPAPRRRKRDA